MEGPDTTQYEGGDEVEPDPNGGSSRERKYAPSVRCKREPNAREIETGVKKLRN